MLLQIKNFDVSLAITSSSFVGITITQGKAPLSEIKPSVFFPFELFLSVSQVNPSDFNKFNVSRRFQEIKRMKIF